MNKEKFLKLVEVLKEFVEHAPDIPSNVCHKKGHFYYTKSGFTFEIAKNKMMTDVICTVNYDRRNSNNLLVLDDSKNFILFNVHDAIIDTTRKDGERITFFNSYESNKDEYFNASLTYNIPFSYQEFKEIFEVLRVNGPEIIIYGSII